MFEETSDFYEKAEGRRAFFGLFGKHRAWADHMDDLGMESPTLMSFKRSLYLDGIRKVIDSGFWKELPEEDKIPAWGHRMFVHGKDGLLLAQIWESKDQRGRREYPLVAAIHIGTGQLPASLDPLWSIFDEIRSMAESAETQEEVREISVHIPSLIESSMRQIHPMGEEGLDFHQRGQFLSSPVMGEQEIGLCRFLYRVSVDLKDFLPGRPYSNEARTFRLPIAEDMGTGSLLAYLNLLRTQIGRSYPVVLCQTMEDGHLDLTVGEMSERYVAELKCSRKKVALVTDVNFNIPDDISNRIRDVIGTFSAEPLSEVMIIADPDAKEKGKSFFGSIINRISKR